MLYLEQPEEAHASVLFLKVLVGYLSTCFNIFESLFFVSPLTILTYFFSAIPIYFIF